MYLTRVWVPKYLKYWVWTYVIFWASHNARASNKDWSEFEKPNPAITENLSLITFRIVPVCSYCSLFVCLFAFDEGGFQVNFPIQIYSSPNVTMKGLEFSTFLSKKFGKCMTIYLLIFRLHQMIKDWYMFKYPIYPFWYFWASSIHISRKFWHILCSCNYNYTNYSLL